MIEAFAPDEAEHLIRRGLTKEVKGAASQGVKVKITFKGAYLTTWKLLWPLIRVAPQTGVRSDRASPPVSGCVERPQQNRRV